MTYGVDVGGKFKIIKQPPEKLLIDWEDFKIKKTDNNTVKIHLSDRTPWYPDIVAKLYVLSQYFKGRLRGHGEDGQSYEVNFPPTKEEIIRASERQIWGIIEDQKFYKEDRFQNELDKIGFGNLYPEWLKTIPKVIEEIP